MSDEDRPVEELVTYEVAEGIARITIDRPETRNALTWRMRDRLGDLLRDASADVGVRAVVLSGAGGTFCAGADLRVPQPPAPRPDDAPDRAPGEVTRLLQRGWQRLITSVLDCDVPVVASVEGVAAGGGVPLALACDVVLAASDARFVLSFVQRGIVPDAGSAYLLARLVGPLRAKELLMLGDPLEAPRAAELGLVTRAVPAEALRAAVDDVTSRLASGPTVALAQTKRLINRALDVDRATALLEEATAQELVQSSRDAQEGVRAFVERRDPDFRGW
ncbi:MAG: enoyl-CoA hydratase/isomerase family protein [Actinobacteria bacterium]|nr:enoyl-CoA hydratase/isomerase family protein [Actinomycetota bacterium]